MTSEFIRKLVESYHNDPLNPDEVGERISAGEAVFYVWIDKNKPPHEIDYLAFDEQWTEKNPVRPRTIRAVRCESADKAERFRRMDRAELGK